MKIMIKKILDSDAAFFADLPPDRWGESRPHIGILGEIQRKKFVQVVILTSEMFSNIISKYLRSCSVI